MSGEVSASVPADDGVNDFVQHPDSPSGEPSRYLVGRPRLLRASEDSCALVYTYLSFLLWLPPSCCLSSMALLLPRALYRPAVKVFLGTTRASDGGELISWMVYFLHVRGDVPFRNAPSLLLRYLHTIKLRFYQRNQDVLCIYILHHVLEKHGINSFLCDMNSVNVQAS